VTVVHERIKVGGAENPEEKSAKGQLSRLSDYLDFGEGVASDLSKVETRLLNFFTLRERKRCHAEAFYYTAAGG